ncbi:hypothetical protein ACA910_015135 [Epithemia clementina (nom. ined.)]
MADRNNVRRRKRPRQNESGVVPSTSAALSSSLRELKAKQPETGDKNTDNNDDDDGVDDMLRWIEGDSFVNRQSIEEEELEQQRKRRLERLNKIKEQDEQSNDHRGSSTSDDAAQKGGQQQEVLKNEDENSKQQQQQHQQPPIMGNELSDKQQSSFDDTTKQQQEQQQQQQQDDDPNPKDSEDDEYDMFNSSVSPLSVEKQPLMMMMGDSKSSATAPASPNNNDNNNNNKNNQKRGHEQSDWDDSEGYYKAVIGETIELYSTGAPSTAVLEHQGPTKGGGGSSSSSLSFRFKVAGVVGKGVFSTVLKCTTISNTTSVELPPTIAMKCVRHNETMAKAAAQEIKLLQQLRGARGVVQLLLPIVKEGSSSSLMMEYRGHVVLVFPYMEYNLRDVLIKFGKGVGLSLQAVRSYFGQLLAAATHLKKHGIIHADLKPDNILVNGDFAMVQLADFGSAFEATAPENQPTPYLVSRYYRAPEIILGLTPTSAIDLWSLSVTVAEIFLGDVVFRGKSNNDMLYVFMQHLGPFSNRLIRQHLVQYQKMPNLIPRQFKQEGTNYMFSQQTVDPVSGEQVHKMLPLVVVPSNHHHEKNNNNSSNNRNNNIKFPLATPLHPKIVKAKSLKDSKALVLEFSDLLHKCLALDPSRRLSVKDALQHKFFQPPPNHNQDGESQAAERR